MHYQTAYRWVRSGQLVAVKVGAGYEISDAAVALLQAQRNATERLPGGAVDHQAAEPAPAVDDGLQLLDLMVDAVTLDSTAVAERATRVAADHLGDAAFLYRGSAEHVTVVYAAHRDPEAEVAASTLGRDPRTSTNLVRRSLASGETICVPQVPQRELRRRLHPELHEHLHLCGCYSAVCAPIGRTGVLLVTRDLPGRPYTNEDASFIASIASRVARADERARSWSNAWELRRAAVAALAAPTFEGNCFQALLESAGPDEQDGVAEPGLAVLDLDLQHVACSKGYGELFGEDATRLERASLRSLVRDGCALDEALAPVLVGEIDFRSVELEIMGDDARLALHVAMVRRADATPRGIVVVAHSVPSLTSG